MYLYRNGECSLVWLLLPLSAPHREQRASSLLRRGGNERIKVEDIELLRGVEDNRRFSDVI